MRSVGVGRGLYRGIPATAAGGGHVAHPEFLAQDPGIVQAVVRGFGRASRYMVEHPDEWTDILVCAHGVSPEATACAAA